MLQTALVGCAHIHTPGFIKMLQGRATEIKVKSVWDHDAERAKKRADELGAAVVADLKEIWKDKEIKAAIVCTETNRHAEVVLPGARAKKHLFVEKPLGMGARDAYKMAKAIEKAGVIFQTGYGSRGHPANLFIREQIQAGSLGKITRIRGSNCHSGSLGRWFDTEWRWMADPQIAGCGAFGDLGTHSLDIMMWMLGDVEAATGSLAVVLGNYGACDESGEALLKFKNGAIGSLAAAWVDVANPVSLLVSGTEGHAYVANGNVYFESAKVPGADGKNPWPLPPGQPAGFELFLNAISGQPHPPLVTAAEAASRSAVMEAIYKGAAAGKWVKPK